MTLQEYFARLQGDTVAVLGIGVSNTPLIERLCANGISVTARDRKSREALGELAERLEKAGATLCLGEAYLDNLQEDVIFRTPGLRHDLPQLVQAQQNGSILTSEMEVFFQVCPCPIFAVTGSDGKTTTTTLMAEMLRRSGKRVFVGGNIGNPLLCEAEQMTAEDFVVLELSSFQLQTMQQSPHIAVITNIAPNHLDWHTDMQEYQEAKENLVRYQTADDIAVYHADHPITRGWSQRAKASVRLFSRKETVENGAYFADGILYLVWDGRAEAVIRQTEIRLPGMHNVENYLAAMAALRDIATPSAMAETAREFGGVEHRMEFVRERRGVRWYNDSIASNPTRCIAGLNAFEKPVILLAGGYDKHIPFTPLGVEIVRHVRHLILCGATADQIEAAVTSCEAYREGHPTITHTATLQEAVVLADRLAEAGDIVTLSPACAAFDQFRDFVERGRFFKKLVLDLEE